MFLEKEETNPVPQPTKTDNPTNHERRYLPRWEVDNKIIYRKGAEAVDYECRSKDIHAMGACLRTDEDILPNQELDLTIYLADDIEPIHVRGKTLWRVAHDKENLVGIHFERINDKTSDLIFHYAFEYKKEELMKRWFKT